MEGRAGVRRERPVIKGVVVTPLRKIADERGCVMHMLRRDDPHFERFGEIYFSTVNAGFVKGWHLHREMALNYAVVSGAIELVLYDDRVGSATHGELMQLFPSESNYMLVHIPPKVWNGFRGLGGAASIVANCATEPHDPAEIVRRAPTWEHIPHDWSANPA